MVTAAWGATSADSKVIPMEIERRSLRADDVAIAIRYCGVCHSDLHSARNDWGRTHYPVVPGHEIVGQVTSVGDAVDGFCAGDWVAVGCLVDSCLECSPCRSGDEQYCTHGATGTYGGLDRRDSSPTYGGYSTEIVVRDRFVLRLPDGLDPGRAAPLLCAGITSYSPLKHWNVGPGSRVGVIGLGGLGHLGVKLARALGAEVTMITTSPEKGADAQTLGASNVLLSSDRLGMKAARGSLDFILDTVPVAHDVQTYLKLLKAGGNLVIVGAVDMMPGIHSGLLLGGRKSVGGSAIGGIAETQELLDLCGSQGIYPEVELIGMHEINSAFQRMEAGNVRYRFVIDMATLQAHA